MKTTEQYKKEIIKILEDNKDLVFIEHIFIKYSGCTKKTFYEHKLHECSEIKELLENNCTNAKQKMIEYWKKPDAGPALQVGAYKLMSRHNDADRRALSQTYIEHTGKDQGPIEVRDMSEADINKRLEELDSEE